MPARSSPFAHPAVLATAAVLAVGAGAAAWLAFGAAGDRFAACREGGGVVGADIGGPFELTRADGVRVTADQVIDRPSLVYFGYTHCPDFCPADAQTMAAAADMLAERGIDVRTVFVTVDPARDDAAALSAFAAAMDPGMVALTGSEADVAAAARAYRVYYARSGSDPEHYLMDHSTYTYLMAPEAGFLDFFRHGTPPEEMAERVACYAEALA